MSLCSRDFFATPLYDILLYVNIIGKFLRLNIFAVFEDYTHNLENLAMYLRIKFYSDSIIVSA